jgi:hypothetical protein
MSGSQGHPLEVQVSKAVGNRITKAQRAGKSTRVRLDELQIIVIDTPSISNKLDQKLSKDLKR